MTYHIRKNKEKSSNKAAYTLVEILVALSVFVIIVLAVSRIYVNILRSQEGVGAENYVQSDLEYFMRFSVNNLRLSEIGDGALCSVLEDKFFLLSSSGRDIVFIKDGQCQRFYLNVVNGVGSIMANLDDFAFDQAMTSSQTNVLDLIFEVEDDISTGQPLVTILVKASPVEDPDSITYVQTSVSVSYP